MRKKSGVGDLAPKRDSISQATALESTKERLNSIVSGLASSDRDLVLAVLQKDRKATAEFVQHHADAIYSYVHHRLIPRVDSVDDIVQDIFLTAWERLPTFRGESSLRGWLLGIARHKVEDHYRIRWREAATVLDADLQGSPDFDEAVDRKRNESKIRSVLEKLTLTHRLILVWRYWDKLSTQQIAARSGKTPKAVERLLARARDQFRRRWSGD